MTDNNCVVCFKNVRIYSVGECDHPVCYECSTRMRVLCRQNECPMCRHEMEMVVFTERIRPFRRIKRDYSLYNPEYHIAFENDYIQDAFENLLQYVCKKCHNKPFNSFDGLTEHMRRVHDLYSCDLCVDNLRIFPKEWRYYTRSDLNKHRRVGDIDDRSHRGHPLCEFCNVRYVDRDELYRHLRKDHLFCHICDSEGIQQFYGMYKMLRDHYKKDHYLCEEGDCIKEEFTSVFPSEIDLKAHKALVHCKNLKNKLAVKQARTLELEFTLAPRSNADRRGRPHGMNTLDNLEEEVVDFNEHPKPDYSRNVAVTWDESAFPSLTNNPTLYSAPHPRFIRESSKKLTFNDENFPALSSETSIKYHITNGDSRPSTSGSLSSTNISLQVNHNHNRNRNRNANRAQTAGPSTSSLSFRWVEKAKEKKSPEKVQKPQETIPPKPPPLSKDNFPKLNSAIAASGENQQKKNKKSSISIHIEESDNQKKSTYNEIVHKHNGNNKSDKTDKKSQSTGKQKEKSSIPQNDNKTNCVLLNANRKKVKMKSDLDSYVSLNNLSESTTKKGQTAAHSFTNGIPSPRRNGKLQNDCDFYDGKGERVPLASSSRNHKDTAQCFNEEFNKLAIAHEKSVCDTKINDKIDKTKNTDKKKTKFDSHSPLKNKENKNDGNSKNSPKKNDKEKKTAGKDNQDNFLKESNKIVSKLDSVPKNTELLEKASKKKSELKIGPLYEVMNGGTASNSLEFESNVQFPPPPPGLEKPIIPPPGLSCLSPKSYDQLTINSSAYNISDGLLAYQQPEDFVTRNSNLIDKIEKSLMRSGEEVLNDFKNTSLLYREGYISAASYYLYCMENIENDKFDDVFVDLVVLLPNIIKQQELWTVHQTMKNDDKHQAMVEHCPICFQILKADDVASHFAKHGLQNVLLSSQNQGK